MNLIEAFIFEKIREITKSNFDWQMFEELAKRSARIGKADLILNYAEERLKALGVGSSRQTFLFSAKKVLKIAMNESGFAQNKTEYEMYSKFKNLDLFTNIYKVGPKNNLGPIYLVSELVREFKEEEEFDAISSIPFNLVGMFISILKYKGGTFEEAIGRCKRRMKEDIDYYTENDMEVPQEYLYFLDVLNGKINLEEQPILKGIFKLNRESDINLGDFYAISHWGKTTDNKVVLLDYGLTEEIWEKYYK